MADPLGRSSPDIAGDLLANPRTYSFFQAVRLIRLLAGQTKEDEGKALFRDIIRIRPLLSLSFPGTDVFDLKEIPRENGSRYQLTATFLGLYGASSPLPTHYTEDLLDEANEDKTVTRDFLDIFNHPFYGLFFQTWTRNRWFIKIAEEQSTVYLERLYSLIGLGDEVFRENLPQARRLLRYVGLFFQFPRSAVGLRTLLSDALGLKHLEVVPNVLRKVKIPEEQRCRLGLQAVTLGQDCYLGQEIDDRMGKIRIVAHDLDQDEFHGLLPGRPRYNEARDLTEAYLNQPLFRELQLVLKSGVAQTAVLGGDKWSSLGWDTWSFSSPELPCEATAVFQL